MGADAMENYCFFIVLVLIYQDQITPHMAINKALKAAGQSMWPAVCRQGFFLNKKDHDFINFGHIHMAFFHEFIIFLELISAFGDQHGLAMQILKQFLRRMKAFAGDFPPQHSSAFRYGGQGFGVKGRVFCIEGAMG
jgi:hypothetical protein